MQGGAVFASGKLELELDGCTVADSEAGEAGGGLDVARLDLAESVDLAIYRSQFLRNKAITDGGAINAWYTRRLLLSQSVISQNQAGKKGGGLRSNDALNSVELNMCTFTQNIAQLVRKGQLKECIKIHPTPSSPPPHPTPTPLFSPSI